MAALSASKKNLVVTCGSKAIVVLLETDEESKCNVVLEPPNLSGQSAEHGADNVGLCEPKDQHNDVVNTSVERPAHIELASFSKCNSWLVLCSNNKQLSLWNTADWSLISNRDIIRTASAVKFTPSGHHILIADKSGDAYMYSVTSPQEKGALLLGHLSMLMDILVTPDEQYVITCDRDEKIRVSHFPNSYNIKTYCLGHEQFVSKINLLPHNSSILTSSSGDGTLRFWDYVSGKSICVISCSNDLQINNCDAESRTCNTDANENLPVKCFTSCKSDENESIVCASLSGFGGCLVYKVSSAMDEQLQSSLLQIVSLDAEPWDILFTESKLLWILSPSKETVINVWTFEESSDKIVCEPSALAEHVISDVAFVNSKIDMFASVNRPCGMTVFYKRKYDNVQVYHERKKLRTMGSASSIQSVQPSKCHKVENLTLAEYVA